MSAVRSKVVVLLPNVASIACEIFSFVLRPPPPLGNHPAQEERASCLTLISFMLSFEYMCYVFFS